MVGRIYGDLGDSVESMYRREHTLVLPGMHSTRTRLHPVNSVIDDVKQYIRVCKHHYAISP